MKIWLGEDLSNKDAVGLGREYFRANVRVHGPPDRRKTQLAHGIRQQFLNYPEDSDGSIYVTEFKIDPVVRGDLKRLGKSRFWHFTLNENEASCSYNPVRHLSALNKDVDSRTGALMAGLGFNADDGERYFLEQCRRLGDMTFEDPRSKDARDFRHLYRLAEEKADKYAKELPYAGGLLDRLRNMACVKRFRDLKGVKRIDLEEAAEEKRIIYFGLDSIKQALTGPDTVRLLWTQVIDIARKRMSNRQKSSINALTSTRPRPFFPMTRLSDRSKRGARPE
jgi:hypothetical protein